jgi:drug/metabolite transporter (DMT)-like permease
MMVSYTIWGWAVQRRGVGRTVVYLFIVPIGTGALSAIFLGEKLTAHKLAGAALVLAGVGFARLNRARRVRPAT